jgi:SAM-dependent methyltransferase
MPFVDILDNVERYYTQKVMAHGATPGGVDWNSSESQTLRFEQLLKVCDSGAPLSINDYGCGYGALVDHMVARAYVFQYRGFDVSPTMIARAFDEHRGQPHCEFFSQDSELHPADYTVASGIFNVKLKTSNEEWTDYTLHLLQRIAELSQRGFAFNVLTRYSDPERRRPDLYYADPLFLFDYCKTNFSRFVTLLHDYPLYEFTILVRK